MDHPPREGDRRGNTITTTWDPLVVLAEEERDGLEGLVRRHLTPQQLALRARIILLLAEGVSDQQIARRFQINRHTVKQWRKRWTETAGREMSATQRLADAPRPGAPPRITPEQQCELVALACTDPQECGRETTHWTASDLADEMANVISRNYDRRIS